MAKKPTYEELERRIQDLEQAKTEIPLNDAKFELGSLKTLIKTLPDEVWFCDAEGNLAIVNEAAARGLGFKKEEDVYQPMQAWLSKLEIYTHDGRPRAQEDAPLLRSLKGEILSGIEEIVFHPKTGEKLYREVSSAPVKNESGQIIGAVALVRDITKHKRLEEERDKLQAQLSSAVELAKLGPWEYDIAKDTYTFNDYFYKIYRTTAGEIGGYTMSSTDYARRFVYPDDALHGIDGIKEYLESANPNEIQQFEHRIIYGDGNVGYIVVKSYIIQDANGKIIKIYGVNQDITERKRAEDILKENNIRLKKLASNVPGMIYQFMKRPDGTYCVPFTSEAIKDIFGCSPEDVNSDFSPIAKVIFPEDLDKVINSIESSGKNMKTWELEYRVQIPGSPVRWFYGKSSPEKLNDGSILWHGFNTDITEHKRLVEALQESEEKYRKLYELESDAIFLIEKDTGNILEVNPAASKMYGFSREEFRRMKNTDVSAESESTYRATHDKLTNIPLRFHKNKDGKVFPVEITASHINWKGKEAHIATIRDISFRINSEKERAELFRQLTQSQKMESIGNLAGGIAHDFNNILASIIGYTELALDEAPKGTIIEDSLQEVYSAGRRAKDLVKQILAFARQSDEKRSPIQPSMIVKEVLKFIRSTIPTTIEIRHKLESDSWIMGNATQIHQVLMNLCTNAAHAMEDSGGILEVSMKEMFFDKEDSSRGIRQGNYVEIKVSDTGVGIASEIIDSIFEPYFTTKGPGEGTGMGLSVAQGVIESYGGKISVDSQLGKGTTFTIHLPITKKRSDQGDYVQEQLPTGTERILFVDDEYPIAKIDKLILESLGYSVTIRTSSIEALELFQVKPNDFDLVVTDMTMPNLTGDKLAVELMKIRPDIPVILCTGYSNNISNEMASEIGIKAFAYKPIVKADLAKTVRKVLDEAKSSNQ